MLVLTRKPYGSGDSGISLFHAGEEIQIEVLQVIGNKVRIGIKAGDDVRIVRSEVASRDALAATGKERGE